MKRIYYAPGLISALVIPVLLWHFGNRKIEEITTSVIDIGIPAKSTKGKSNDNNPLEPVRNFDLKKIEVPTGKAKENSALYVSEVRALQKRNERHTGIEFILGKENTYGDFVSLLNDMAISKHEEYVLDMEKTGNLLVPVTYLDPYPLAEPCLLCNDVVQGIDHGSLIDDFPEPNIFDKTQYFLTLLTKEAYFLILGFLILSYLSILSFKERFKLYTSN
ncbi:hypothetical protein [Chryseobacterium jejuense]|uniref:Uncharacterized protein n=1 Tax=Chryseobacterium jejuense TaxID=445960 RepID=A0A2X2X790_CHRJE|nr:hypothetical protein [Chryseobacterium jejuense]SDI17038.1 hypothetical protein SAMN05421542_0302 [Chryseobacterium jejuense]SQB46571.1 Uncharacterised protein [Chryseobacterium jejuense]